MKVNKENTYLMTISMSYPNTQMNALTGMESDSTDLIKLFDPNGNYSSNIYHFKRSTSKSVRDNVLSKLRTIKSKVENGDCKFFIFHFSGHGGKSGNSEYMIFYNYKTKQKEFLYDYQLWEILKDFKIPVFCMFCCCHAGQMFKAVNPYAKTSDDPAQTPPVDFASSAERYFKNTDGDIQTSKMSASPDKQLLGASSEVSPTYKNLQLYVWGACGVNESSYMGSSIEETHSYGVDIDRTGHLMMSKTLYYYTKKNIKTYSKLWTYAGSAQTVSWIVYDYDKHEKMQASDTFHPVLYPSQNTTNSKEKATLNLFSNSKFLECGTGKTEVVDDIQENTKTKNSRILTTLHNYSQHQHQSYQILTFTRCISQILIQHMLIHQTNQIKNR